MKAYLRENPTIAFGLGLPLLLVIVFLLISGIPSFLVKSPQYDVLYATQYGRYGNSLNISVVGNKAQVTLQGDWQQNNDKPHLWRYSPKTGAVKEIFMILPQGLARPGDGSINPDDVNKVTVVDVPDIDDLTIDSSSIAPDGYEFSAGNDRYSRNSFGSLFYSSRYGYEAALTKNGRTIRLPNSEGSYYRGDTQFIGWVVAQ